MQLGQEVSKVMPEFLCAVSTILMTLQAKRRTGLPIGFCNARFTRPFCYLCKWWIMKQRKSPFIAQFITGIINENMCMRQLH